MFNAMVLKQVKDSYIITTQIGITGFLKTRESLRLGDFINVDILGTTTKEFEKDFWGAEFRIVDSYIDFWNNIWEKSYKITEIYEDSFEIIAENNNVNIIHRDFKIDFYSSGMVVSFDEFLKSIKLGVSEKDITISFIYSFPTSLGETNLFRILSCHSDLISDLK